MKNATTNRSGAQQRFCACSMRSINIDSYNIVLQGEVWKHDIAPCCRESVSLLENNESIITWLAPKKGCEGQSGHIPSICFQGQYWTLSLRMSKCVFRSVRLRRGFSNIQTVHGIQTLRIPQLLLNEKQRTQARFEVSLRAHADVLPSAQRHVQQSRGILLYISRQSRAPFTDCVSMQKLHIKKKGTATTSSDVSGRVQRSRKK
jgi:hypothetical protein